jgi:hypothetical protein
LRASAGIARGLSHLRPRSERPPPESLSGLGSLARSEGQGNEAEALLRESLEGFGALAPTRKA